MSEGGSDRRAQYHEAIGKMKESSTIDEEKPFLIGEGSDHAVFELKGLAGEGQIAKVNVHSVVSAIRENQRRGKMLNYIDETERARIRVRREEVDASLARMRKYFGNAVLPEHLTVRQVPISNELLEVMTHGDAHRPKLLPGTHETLALVTLQKRAPEAAFRKGSAFDLQSRYVEMRNPPPVSEYEEITRVCIDSPQGAECGKMLEKVAGDIAVFARAERNLALRSTLKDFIAQAIRFSRDTGDQLDLAGPHNVRAYRAESDEWKTIIMDGRYRPGRFAAVADVIAKLSNDAILTSEEASILLNGLAYTRFINAAAARLGVHDRLNVSPLPIARMSQKILDILKAPKKS